MITAWVSQRYAVLPIPVKSCYPADNNLTKMAEKGGGGLMFYIHLNIQVN